MRPWMILAAFLLTADPDTLHDMAVGACLGVAEQVLGRPAWQLSWLAPAVAADCQNDPVGTMRRLQGGVFVEPRPATTPAERPMLR